MSQHPLYLLDTDIASYAMQDRSGPVRQKMKYVPTSSICISVITAAELLFGIKRLPTRDATAVSIRSFVHSSQVFLWNVAAAEAHADIRHSLTTTGNLIGELDMMIAAHALALDAVLVTNNTRHFERIAPPLKLENWTEA